MRNIGVNLQDDDAITEYSKTCDWDKLNDLGSEIDNETTFREYAERIEDLYEEWPKINDEDTTINLENTKKAKMKIILKGNINQNEVPTPNNPINIDIVTGNNIINFIGKN